MATSPWCWDRASVLDSRGGLSINSYCPARPTLYQLPAKYPSRQQSAQTQFEPLPLGRMKSVDGDEGGWNTQQGAKTCSVVPIHPAIVFVDDRNDARPPLRYFLIKVVQMILCGLPSQSILVTRVRLCTEVAQRPPGRNRKTHRALVQVLGAVLTQYLLAQQDTASDFWFHMLANHFGFSSRDRLHFAWCIHDRNRR